MAMSAKAIVKDAVFYGSSEACHRAPCGEYRIDRRCDCVGFCDCNGEHAFTLSLDAFLQHVTEGRIAVLR